MSYEPTEIPQVECRELLHGGIVGRVGLVVDGAPRIVPVNYALVDEAIVFRTTPYGMLGQHAWDTMLAFEVDHLDYERHRGWSVLAVGPGERIDDAGEVAEIEAFRGPQPWAAGSRILHIRLRWHELTGRRLGNWTRDEEMPVRRV